MVLCPKCLTEDPRNMRYEQETTRIRQYEVYDKNNEVFYMKASKMVVFDQVIQHRMKCKNCEHLWVVVGIREYIPLRRL